MFVASSSVPASVLVRGCCQCGVPCEATHVCRPSHFPLGELVQTYNALTPNVEPVANIALTGRTRTKPVVTRLLAHPRLPVLVVACNDGACDVLRVAVVVVVVQRNGGGCGRGCKRVFFLPCCTSAVPSHTAVFFPFSVGLVGVQVWFTL